MAAKRQRNYRAEEARRNELARARGFTSRGQQRRAIDRGVIEPLAPERTFIARALRIDSMMDNAYDWSTAHAKHYEAMFRPQDALDHGLSEGEYTRAYSKAFVEGNQRYGNVRRRGGSPALRRWFVDTIHWYSPAEYEAKYEEHV